MGREFIHSILLMMRVKGFSTNLLARNVIALTLMTSSLLSCQVANKQKASVVTETPSVNNFGAYAHTTIHCGLPKPECSDPYQGRTMCRVGNDNLRVWLPGEAPSVWADSHCEGRSALWDEVCKKPEMATLPMPAYCIPDPSEGECPPVGKDECKKAQDTHVCVAETYLGRPLPPQHRVMGVGAGECEAQVNLKKVACNLQLRPSQLGAVRCNEVEEERGCKEFTKQCADTYQPAICEAVLKGGGDSTERTSSWGRNSCHAQAALKRRICMEPSAKIVQEITCQVAQ